MATSPEPREAQDRGRHESGTDDGSSRPDSNNVAEQTIEFEEGGWGWYGLSA